MRIILYQKIVKLGGTYTFDLNFARELKKHHEIVYFFEAGEQPLLNEMEKHAQLVKNEGQPVEADLCIYSGIYQASHRITARCFIQMLHTDLVAWDVKYKPVNIDLHVAVGEGVATSFKEKYGLEAKVIPNILNEPSVEKVLRLITASRIAQGKGFDRTVDLAKALKKHGRPFTWEIYGTGSRSYMNKLKYPLSNIPNVVLMGARNNVQSYMKTADYVVQLSDNEGFCYSMFEALQIQVPVIVTRWPGVEATVKDGENGYILDMDLENLEIDKLYDSIPKGGKLEVRNSVQLWNELFKAI